MYKFLIKIWSKSILVIDKYYLIPKWKKSNIVLNPNIMGGTPCIKGTRLPYNLIIKEIKNLKWNNTQNIKKSTDYMLYEYPSLNSRDLLWLIECARYDK